jgi:HSP20 family protein
MGWENDKEQDEDYRRAWAEFRENENEFILEVELPGIDKKDIIINTEGNKLEIIARKKYEIEQNDKKKGCYNYSKSYAGFRRIVSLPEESDAERICANFENGVLSVKIPKKKNLKMKKKEIKVM